MKENHIRDPLEEYFRQSLGEREKAPPDDLWERIEADLPPPATAAPRPWWEPYRFLLAAAAAAVLVVLALTDPTRSWRYPEPALAPMLLSSDTTDRTAGNHTAPVQPLLQDQGRDIALPKAPLSTSLEPMASLPSAISIEKPQSRTRPTPSLRASRTRSSSTTQEHPTQHPPAAYEKKRAPNSTEPTTSLAPLVNSDQATEEAPAEQIPDPSSLSAPSSLPPLRLSIESSRALSVNATPLLPTTRPAHPLRGWCLGLYAAWMYALPPQVTPSVQAPPPGRPFRPIVFSQPQEQQPTLVLGVRAGKRMGATRQWGVELGLAFLENKSTTVHISRFRFGDGRKLPGGGGHTSSRREFSYSLNTYGGSAAIDLRMEPTNTSDPLLNTEPVVVRAEATEHTQWLQVPLWATYAIGSGRLVGVARAGLVADVLLKSELNMTSFVSQNNRLRLALGDSPTVEWTPARSLSVGYWLSAGATYRWNRHWSLSLEPTAVGAFARKDAKGQPLPLSVSLGGQLGLVHTW